MKPFVEFKLVDEDTTIRFTGYTVYMHQPEVRSIDEEGTIDAAQCDYNMISSQVDSQLDELVKHIERLEKELGVKESNSSCNIYRFRNNCKELGAYYQRNKNVVRPDLEK